MNRNPTFIEQSGEVKNYKTGVDILSVPLLDEKKQIIGEMNQPDAMLPLAQPYLTSKDFDLIKDAFDSSWISSTGEFISEFENNFASEIGTKYGAAVSNGTSALYLALKALNVGAGDKVIIPNLTFAAVANAVVLSGASPVFIDVESNRPTLDLELVENCLDDKIKAIIVVHSYGHIVDVPKLRSIIPPNIKIIEDCAESHFGSLDGVISGSKGDVSTFSFFANKIITTGEGGICLSNDRKVIETIKSIRDHGMSKSKRYWHDQFGFNFRMTNIQAAMGCAQLEKNQQSSGKEPSLCQYGESISKIVMERHLNFIKKDKKMLVYGFIYLNARRNKTFIFEQNGTS